ncbi:hypothetical protein [Pseudolysobacter antarcticus]|nr:hypothetical protein [Pseudolysobacter antarcticus]
MSRVLISIFAPMILSAAANAGSDLDPLWNPPGGYTVTHVGTGDAIVNAVAMDSLGRMVVAGYSTPSAGGNAQFSLVRYHGDDFPTSIGYEDLTFNSTGIAYVAVGIGNTNGYAVQIGTNDSIVVAGDCTTPMMPQNHTFCLARFTSGGAIDTSFGTSGKLITRVGPDDAFAKAMTKDAAGNFLVAGYSSSYLTGNPVFTVVRYSPSGVADSTFGFAGYAGVAETSGGTAQAAAITMDGNGAIVVAGSIASLAYPSGAFAVTRLLASGAPDPSFNSGNIAVVGFANGGAANAVAVDASNRPILAGFALPTGATSSLMTLARFTSAGALDTSFGSGGVASPPLSGCTEASASGIKLDALGRAFVSGTCKNTQNVLVLAHYNANGTLDTAFAPNGYETEVFGNYASASALVLDGKGRPVVVGQRIASGVSEFVINRHDYIFSHGFE